MAHKLRDSVSIPVKFDGVDNTLVVDLSLPPISKQFAANQLPTEVKSDTFALSEPIDFTGSFDGTVLTVVFESAPPEIDTTLSVQYYFELP